LQFFLHTLFICDSNGSGGKRGAASAEYFLSHGYAVLFLHRLHSLQPFSRHFQLHQDDAFVGFLQVSSNGTVIGYLSLSPSLSLLNPLEIIDFFGIVIFNNS
jgi:phosphopantothenate-cysteine ligase